MLLLARERLVGMGARLAVACVPAGPVERGLRIAVAGLSTSGKRATRRLRRWRDCSGLHRRLS
jgi:hypothetical protein